MHTKVVIYVWRNTRNSMHFNGKSNRIGLWISIVFLLSVNLLLFLITSFFDLLMTPKIMSKQPKRKFHDRYLELGFVPTIQSGEEKPLCLICRRVLANSSFTNTRLTNHMNSHNLSDDQKSLDHFQHLRDQLNNELARQSPETLQAKALTKTSFELSHLIAKTKKPHSIGQQLLKPGIEIAVRNIFGGDNSNIIKRLPLSDSTVNKRIKAMSNDVLDQLINALLKSPKYSVQMDCAKDSGGRMYLSCFVRYLDEENGKCMIKEDFLFCKRMHGGKTGEEIFEIFSNFLNEHDIDIDNCIALCTDGAAEMLGSLRGVHGRMKRRVPHVILTHCIIHREALAVSNTEVAAFEQVIEIVLKAVNSIKSDPVRSNAFSALCEDMGEAYASVLYYCDVRWLSMAFALERVFKLRESIYSFSQRRNPALSAFFHEPKFLIKLAYLTDIFNFLNELNLKLQGPDRDIFQLHDQIRAHRRKILNWKNQFQNEERNLHVFRILHEFLDEHELHLSPEIRIEIITHLEKLEEQFAHYFPNDPLAAYGWVQDPFNFESNLENYNLTPEEIDEMFEVVENRRLKRMFDNPECTLITFWSSVHRLHPRLCMKALEALLPFATTYLCEQGFSAVACIVTKQRNALILEPDMRLAISKIQPRIEDLTNQMQFQPSH